jgi:recombinational DNA repair protein (RecF pathway)
MGAELLVTTGVVIGRAARGEDWLRVTLFSPEHGVVDALQRIPKRAVGKSPVLDLFDDARFTLESSTQGRTWFVREAVIERRRPGLGASYPALREACRLAQVVARNPLHEESRAAIYALLARALDAWEAHAHPEAVYFKSLFLIARDEGYPVREEWQGQLEREDRAHVERVLREPAATQTTGQREIARLSRALEEYLHHSTAMRFQE